MKIHSSSIATLPAKHNAYQKSNVQQGLASQEIKIEDQKPLELQSFSIETNKTQNTPINSFANRALLDAYGQENSQLIKN